MNLQTREMSDSSTKVGITQSSESPEVWCEMGSLLSLPGLRHLSPIPPSEFLILEPVDSEVIILRDMGLGRTIPLAFLNL